MGTALIVLTWVLFAPMGCPLWANIILTVVGAFIALFALLFIVYFFNLDMKLTSSLEPLLIKLNEKKKRNRKI